MTENLIDRIKTDFFEAGGCPTAVDEFCAFAKNWLEQKQAIGVGNAPAGFTVLFADRSEALLADAPNVESNSGFAVALGGTPGRSDRTLVDNSGVNITGR